MAKVRCARALADVWCRSELGNASIKKEERVNHAPVQAFPYAFERAQRHAPAGLCRSAIVLVVGNFAQNSSLQIRKMRVKVSGLVCGVVGLS